ncbi:DUF2635 domain-containing protein [Vibrio cholerae]|nr:DUF2635 domain-containing protein [Vibrio cholerae]
MLMVIQPAKPEVKVRKEDGTHLAAGGEEVKRSAFWARRIKDGDVKELTEDEATAWRKTIADAYKKVRAEAKKAAQQSAAEVKGE